MLFTAWWISIIAQYKWRHHGTSQWLIPTVLWIFIMIRLITWHTKKHYTLFKMVASCWNYLVSIRDKIIPEKYRLIAGTCVVIATVLVGTFVPEETADSKKKDRAISFFGVLVFLFLVWLSSENKKAINWYTVNNGMLMQFIIAVFVLRTNAGYDFFNFISTLARQLLAFSKSGVAFLTSTETSQIVLLNLSLLFVLLSLVKVNLPL
ncbi:unnamed protein product [Ambrosiozyma monospora]|uniref:Unnamed protein product n=1 Tax=Ambrosiozyma monospora TaxID=43982 RepID=A0ACB5U968_AMBMO|nr:unnamed protein product [Ambrosiozyma monospora]